MIAQQRLSPVSQALPLRERAVTRLAILSGGTFVGVLAVLILMAIFGAYTDSRRAEADAVVQPAQLVIDPKIETDLSKAMSFDSDPTAAEVQNPFVDRDSISGAAASSTAAAVRTSTTASADGARTNTVSVGGRQTVGGPGDQIRDRVLDDGEVVAALGLEVVVDQPLGDMRLTCDVIHRQRVVRRVGEQLPSDGDEFGAARQ